MIPITPILMAGFKALEALCLLLATPEGQIHMKMIREDRAKAMEFWTPIGTGVQGFFTKLATGKLFEEPKP